MKNVYLKTRTYDLDLPENTPLRTDAPVYYMLDKQLQHFEDIENKNKTDNFEVSHVTLTLRVATRTV